MPDLPETETKAPTRRWFISAGIAVALLGSLYGGWMWINSDPPFSQQQYDDGYLEAFRINMTGPGYVDYKSEYWSMQRGFDDGIANFRRIYQHPDVSPFSYSRIDRFRDVLARIESTDLLDPTVKERILKQLRTELSELESSAEPENGE